MDCQTVAATVQEKPQIGEQRNLKPHSFMPIREPLHPKFFLGSAPTALLFCAVLVGPTFPATAATLTWSGAGANNNWSTGGNWAGTAPVAGDALLFPGGSGVDVTSLNNTNDFASNTVFRAISISGTNYVLNGNQVLFTNSGAVALSGQGVGSNTVQLPIQFASNNQGFVCLNAAGILVVSGAINLNGRTLTNNPIGEIDLGGVISGTGNLIKNGAGRLVLNGTAVNTYAGTMTVNAGNLGLSDASAGSAVMITSNLIINSGATVNELKGDQIADVANVTVNGTGIYNLVGGANDTIRSLILSAGHVATSTGTLRLGGNLTNLASGSGISGNLSVGGPAPTVQMTTGGLSISAGISDGDVPGAGLTVVGPGQLTLSGANTYTGPTLINGSVIVANTAALGIAGDAASGTIVTNLGATLLVQGVDIGNEFLTLGGGADFRSSGTASWAGPVELTGNAGINVLSGTFTNSGLISGVGGFTKGQPGTLILAGSSANTFVGPVVVNAGVLELAKSGPPALGSVSSLTVGDGLGGADADVVRYRSNAQMFSFPIFINASGLLDLNGNTDEVGPITMDSGRIATGAGQLQMEGDLVAYNLAGGDLNPSISGFLNLFGADRTFNVIDTLNVTASILDLSPNGILKTGIGSLFLSSSNSYRGLTIVQQGYLWAENAFALGATNNGTVVSNNASLVLNGPTGFTNESLTLNGVGASVDYGALDAETVGTTFWVGPITLNGSCTIVPYWDATVLQLIGVLSGPGGFTQSANSTAGTLVLEGNTANVFAGPVTVNSGTLLLNKPAGQSAVPGNLVVGDGSGGVNADVVRLLNNSQIVNAADVLVNSSGRLVLDNFAEQFDTLRGTGNLTLGVGGQLGIGVNNGSSTFDGLISGAGVVGGYALGKFGTGVFALKGDNSYLADTHVFNGNLTVLGSQPQSAVIVDGAGLLSGTGTVGNVTNVSGGVIAPGSSPGILTCSNVFFSGASSDFTVELNGPAPGTGYDQLSVRGGTSLGGCTLNVSVGGGFVPTAGLPLVILTNQAANPITGLFNGLAEGAIKTVGGFNFVVSYVGGSGNDVTLTLTNLPSVKAILGLVVGGNGNNAIDPNECNHFYLILTNLSGSPFTDVSATLTTTSEHVIVTQPASRYPDMAVNAGSTNLTPFQITTLPTFPCGSNLDLVLTLNTSAGSRVATFTQAGNPTGSLLRFDNNTSTPIPVLGNIDSTNVASGINYPIAAVTVSLYLSHTNIGDLVLVLFAPDGTGLPLSSFNGGAGVDYGAGCAEGSRTVFDDAAATTITAGTPPFVGTFRPQVALATFVGHTGAAVNGPWRLQVRDALGSTTGNLQCWSLFISTSGCADGGGICETCPGQLTNSITPTDPTNPNRLVRNVTPATCAAPLACSGVSTATGPFHYKTHSFTNSGGPACVTVYLDTPAADTLTASAYLGSYDPTNVCQNLLAEMGNIPSKRFDSLSFALPGPTNFVVVVNEVNASAGYDYSLVATGVPCPALLLTIKPAPANKVRLDWSTAAGGYLLESTNKLSAGLSPSAAWPGVSNAPVVVSGRFTVTNAMSGTNTFFRLRKP